MKNIFDIVRLAFDPFVKDWFLRKEAHNKNVMHMIETDAKRNKIVEYKSWCKQVSDAYEYKHIIGCLKNNFDRYYYSTSSEKYSDINHRLSSSLNGSLAKRIQDSYDAQVRDAIKELHVAINKFFDRYGSFNEIVSRFNEVYSYAIEAGIKVENLKFDFYGMDQNYGLSDKEWEIYKTNYTYNENECRPNIDRWSYKENGWTIANHEIYCLLQHLAIICAQCARFNYALDEFEKSGIMCSNEMRTDHEWKKILKKTRRNHDNHGSYEKIYDNAVLTFSKELKEDEEHEKKVLESCDKISSRLREEVYEILKF